MFVWLFLSVSFAQDYIFFYGNGCPHCAKVEKFFDENDIEKTFSLEKKEIYFNRNNLNEFNEYIEKLQLPSDQIGVPMLIIDSDLDSCTYLAGDKSIIDFFQKKIDESIAGWCSESENCDPLTCDHQNCTHENCEKQGTIIQSTSIKKPSIETNIIAEQEIIDEEIVLENKEKEILGQRIKFFGIMMPAALADSINPCAFAVMLLLLTAILSVHQSRRKTLLAGLLFAFAVFISYFAMGLGLFSALATMNNTFILKLVVGILGILVWLANLKDYFWYGKWFVMEVPFSRRPKMQDMIHKVSSPWWAFVIWLLVSIFLLPCSSWPYFTILGYLSAESKELHTRGYIYLLVYNLIFILPMAIIAILVAFGYSTVDKLAKIKHTNTKLIHLIVWLLMLWLWLYVLLTM